MKNAIKYPCGTEREISLPKSFLLQKSKRTIRELYDQIEKRLLSIKDLMEEISFRQHSIDTSRFEEKLELINRLNNKRI